MARVERIWKEAIEEWNTMEYRPDAVGMEKYNTTKNPNPCYNWFRIVKIYHLIFQDCCGSKSQHQEMDGLVRAFWICLWFINDTVDQITMIREIGVMSTNLANINQL